MDQKHIAFIKNFYTASHTFEPTAFYSHFGFKASAQKYATDSLKNAINTLQRDDDQAVSAWAKEFAAYDYQALNTTHIDEYWLSVAQSSTATMKRTAREQISEFGWQEYNKASYERQVNQKKQKTQHHENKMQTKSSRDADIKALSVQSNDSVQVSWSSETLGTIIKAKTRLYIEDKSTPSSSSSKDLESVILLAQNNILNLADRSSKGQRNLFNKDQWVELKQTWSLSSESWSVAKETKEMTLRLSKIARRNIDDGIVEARAMYKRMQLSADDRNFFCFSHKLFEIVERHPEPFDDEKKKSLTENDFIVRVWSPLLFALFEDCRNVELTWGESVLRGEGDDSYYKVDLRLHFRNCKKQCNLSVGEFAKNANLSKLRSDHVKLLLEGVAIFSSLIQYDFKPAAGLLQCAGTEADFLYVKKVDKCFTVANRAEKGIKITKNLEAEKLISVYSSFLRYKHVTIDLMNHVIASVDALETSTFNEALQSAPSSQE